MKIKKDNFLMQNFTPISALIGGALIGSSAVLMLWLNGRIAGVSGIFHGLFSFRKGDFSWRASFLVGMIAGCCLYYFVPQIHFTPRTHYPVMLLILSGFLVGIGTRLSGGCTSGHGVCGIARLSTRSFVATLIFFLMGVITVYLLRHVGND
jgi:uncharacterized protein